MPHVAEPLTSRDGLTLYSQCWQPGGTGSAGVRAAATLVVVHGFTEHSGRYARWAEALNAEGYAVHALDLRGHGRSAGEACDIRRFEEYLDDLDLLVARATVEAAGRPTFLFGHSMGGTIAALYAITRQPSLSGLILSSAGLQVGSAVFPWLRRLAPLAGRLFPRFRLVRMGGGRISRDPAVVAAFRSDPLVFHGRFPLRIASEIFAAMRVIRRRRHEVRLPLLVLHGTGDAVCAWEASQQLYQAASATDKTLHLYPGLYHELFSEPEREQVLADLVAWLDARC